jgi:activating signal cointegrator 1
VRAVSLWQPWASAMALGLKTVETRHWRTNVRGPVAIHAAKRWTREERELAEAHGLALPLPLGAVVAVGRLMSIHSTDRLADRLNDWELAWGNYAPGRFGWIFEDIRPLSEPVPCIGRQGFFDLPGDVAALVSQRTPLRGE